MKPSATEKTNYENKNYENKTSERDSRFRNCCAARRRDRLAGPRRLPLNAAIVWPGDLLAV
jgi:hypothetical protein